MSNGAHSEPANKHLRQPDPQILGLNAVSQLTSYQQRDLLDAIDKLRRSSISSEDFSIPQVVVCGDQSAGKSSVLEAISRLRFPVRGSNATTKFATEVVLRNDSSAATMPVKLKILADNARTPEGKSHIENFSFDVDTQDPKAFSTAVEAALEYLESYEPDKKFWYDRLHVEISGPKQPNLTLVDLPGLIQQESHARPGDKQRIKNLVKRYISEPKTTILAVVSAINDIENQEVIQLVKDSNDAIERTIGVLTKGDRAVQGSDDEETAILLASNRKVPLRLGWHALRNMDHQKQGAAVSYEHRDEVEQSFFSKRPWSQIDKKNVGIDALREKLSQSLFGSITHDLPAFVGLMQDKLQECRAYLDKLGAARDSPDSQSYHLQRIQRDLQSLIQDALDGREGRSDFADFFDGSSNRVLRTTINRYSSSFALKMREEGKQYNIFGPSNGQKAHFEDYSPHANKPNFYPPYRSNGAETRPINVSLEAYCDLLAAFMDDTRGTSLQGFQAPSTQIAIFRQQSVFWGAISKEYVGACYTATLEFLRCAVAYVADRHTGEKLMRAFMEQSYVDIGTRLDAKLDELLWPYQKSHLSTQNPDYTSNVSAGKKLQENQSDGDKDGIEADSCAAASWTEAAKQLHLSDELIFAAEALDITDAYYNLALNTFVDNVTTLGVEAILLDKIKGLLAFEDIARLKADRLAEIASEPPGAQQKRDELNNQVAVLIEVIQTCKKYQQTSSSYANHSPLTSDFTEASEQNTHDESAVFTDSGTTKPTIRGNTFSHDPPQPNPFRINNENAASFGAPWGASSAKSTKDSSGGFGMSSTSKPHDPKSGKLFGARSPTPHSRSLDSRPKFSFRSNVDDDSDFL